MESGGKNMEMSETEIEMVKVINGEIEKRTEYGMRVEHIEKHWSRLSWSNGSEEWGCDNIRSWGTAKIDSNEIIVPYAAKDVIPVVEFLAELPLFRHSTEAVERGYVSREEATMEWMKKQLEM